VKLAALLDKESIILPLKAKNRFEAIKKLLEGVDSRRFWEMEFFSLMQGSKHWMILL
jgi:hypothetical protein